MSARRHPLFEPIIGIARQFRDARRSQRAERILNSLPAHLRKDIGWPDSERFLGDKSR